MTGKMKRILNNSRIQLTLRYARCQLLGVIPPPSYNESEHILTVVDGGI